MDYWPSKDLFVVMTPEFDHKARISEYRFAVTFVKQQMFESSALEPQRPISLPVGPCHLTKVPLVLLDAALTVFRADE